MTTRYALLLSVGLLATSAHAQVATSFEQPAFTAGDLLGQDGWLETASFSVTSAKAKSGTQSLEWDAANGAYAWKDLAAASAGSYHAQVSIYMDPSGSTDRFFGIRLESGTTGEGFGLGAEIAPDGSIYASSDAPFNVNPVGKLSGTPTGRWVDVSVDYTTGATNGVATVDGQVFNLSGLTAISSVTTADLYVDFNNNPNSVGVGYFDDYQLQAVPEPACLGLLGISLAGFVRRRYSRR